MADVLAMSERAGSLAKELGDYLGAFGSTPEMKRLGSSISTTADNLVAEVRRRTTRKAAPAASASALRSGSPRGPITAAGSALRLPPGVSAVQQLIGDETRRKTAAGPVSSSLTTTGRRALPTITGPAPPSKSPANIAREAQNAALKAAAEQVKAAAKPSGLLGRVAKAVGLKPAAAPSPFPPRRPLSSLPEEEAEENADEEEAPAGSPAAAASRMAGLFGATDTIPGAADTLNAAKAALVKGQKGGKRRRTRRNRKGL
jgi:hypothetical protein